MGPELATRARACPTRAPEFATRGPEFAIRNDTRSAAWSLPSTRAGGKDDGR